MVWLLNRLVLARYIRLHKDRRMSRFFASDNFNYWMLWLLGRYLLILLWLIQLFLLLTITLRLNCLQDWFSADWRLVLWSLWNRVYHRKLLLWRYGNDFFYFLNRYFCSFKMQAHGRILDHGFAWTPSNIRQDRRLNCLRYTFSNLVLLKLNASFLLIDESLQIFFLLSHQRVKTRTQSLLNFALHLSDPTIHKHQMLFIDLRVSFCLGQHEHITIHLFVLVQTDRILKALNYSLVVVNKSHAVLQAISKISYFFQNFLIAGKLFESVLF